MSLKVPLITDQHIYSDYSWPPYQLSASNTTLILYPSVLSHLSSSTAAAHGFL